MPPEASQTAQLSGLTVLVTGASSGIGRAIALAAARAGADLGLTYSKNENGAQETAASATSLGRRARVFRLDLAERSSIDAVVRDMAASFGHVDVWINNAGADILTGAGAKLPREAKLDRLLTVDLRGTILASWAAADLLGSQEAGGAIINMSWDHVITGMEGRNPQMFAAVKGGVLAFSKSLARSVGPKVRVNVLAPGWIETAFAHGTMDPARRKAVAESTPLKRWGTPEDVANTAVFLASPAAGFLTGQTIFVNGGGGNAMTTKEATYSETELAAKLAELPGWYYEDKWIRRWYKTDGWPITLMLVNAIGFLAEAANHHPDLSVTWARVGVKLATHSAGGITGKDFALARQIEDVALWRPQPGGPLEGNPKKFVQSGDRR